MEDKRFAHIANDPKFRRIPKGERKVKIDKRFQSMFKDKQFKVKYTIDKRGRPVSHTSTEDLKRYYDITSDEESSESENDIGKFVKAPKSNEESEINELENKHVSDKSLPDNIKKKLRNLNVDYARGESALYSGSSSDDEESDDELSEAEEIDHKWGELDADAEQIEEATYRLAACNMDWDRIRAIDLMVLFNSFLPPGGIIKSVAIYPSEFGKKRMQEEEIKGPIELVESKIEENVDETEEGSSYHMEKLRQYQLNRLKYYYAVIIFDSPNSANKIYTECDGMEYESSATKIDLRFISDDMNFDEEPKELCDKLPEINKYQPRFFTTTALQQAKVDLTWDETNPGRLEIAEKLKSGKVEDISEADLQNYLASSSGEENENEVSEESDNENGVNSIDKYKALLQDIEQKEQLKNNKDVEMEISWGIDLKEKTENLVKKKLAENEAKTPFQQYLEKRKEKRKEKRDQRKKKSSEIDDSDSDIPSDIDMNDPYFAEEFNNPDFKKNKRQKEKISHDIDEQKQAELELLLMNEDDNKNHFNLKNIQNEENVTKSKKRKHKKNVNREQKAEDNFEVNVQDERFSALFTSHHFNIDPTDSHYKKTRGMETLINEKLKRRTSSIEPESKKPKVQDKIQAELKVLLELDLMNSPERIYNVDEKGCRLSLHHQQSVLVRKGAKRVHLVAPEHGENVTIVSCGNAGGNSLPPTILFKGKRLKPEWTDTLPPGSLCTYPSRRATSRRTNERLASPTSGPSNIRKRPAFPKAGPSNIQKLIITTEDYSSDDNSEEERIPFLDDSDDDNEKKAINSRALVVKKTVFDTNKKATTTPKATTAPKATATSKVKTAPKAMASKNDSKNGKQK
ncbi:hypothetical protein NQ314_016894 [Rhamnusium bicolor]|uniref:ESF1-like protein n=1 Tax=Rhamnusium bicolor TaxID=1586634 RepID=A0AAV8WUQ4_9CUCU|nr:hypothetical protein NQ314_016894 [Rhamnusium bicolor]